MKYVVSILIFLFLAQSANIVTAYSVGEANDIIRQAIETINNGNANSVCTTNYVEKNPLGKTMCLNKVVDIISTNPQIKKNMSILVSKDGDPKDYIGIVSSGFNNAFPAISELNVLSINPDGVGTTKSLVVIGCDKYFKVSGSEEKAQLCDKAYQDYKSELEKNITTANDIMLSVVNDQLKNADSFDALKFAEIAAGNTLLCGSPSQKCSPQCITAIVNAVDTTVKSLSIKDKLFSNTAYYNTVYKDQTPDAKKLSNSFFSYFLIRHIAKTQNEVGGLACGPGAISEERTSPGDGIDDALLKLCESSMGASNCVSQSISNLIDESEAYNWICKGYENTDVAGVNEEKLKSNASCGMIGAACCGIGENDGAAKTAEAAFCQNYLCSDNGKYAGTTYCTSLKQDHIFENVSRERSSSILPSIQNQLGIGADNTLCLSGTPMLDNSKVVLLTENISGSLSFKDRATGKRIDSNSIKERGCMCNAEDGQDFCTKYLFAPVLQKHKEIGFNDVRYLKESDINDSFSKDTQKDIKKTLKEVNMCTACINKNGMWTGIGCIYVSQKNLVADILKIGLGIAGVWCLFIIIFSAIQIQLFGSEAKKLEEARSRITSAITGLLVIIFSVLILKIIGIDILGFNYIFK